MAIIQSNTTITSSLNTTSAPYHPISCDFHDELEILATSRKRAVLRYVDEVTQVQIEQEVSIVDVFTEKGIEYICINKHGLIRLDLIVSINNKKLVNYRDTYCES